MSALLQLQWDFTTCVVDLLRFAKAEGYDIALGEVWRSPATAAANAKAGTGIANSLHIVKLAIDLNLFRDGVFLEATEDHALLGAHWKMSHPRARWGGDFRPRPDGNHYSLEWEGRK